MDTHISALDALERSDQLRSLDELPAVVTFLRALGLSRDERAHSRVLGLLLDSRRSSLANCVVSRLLDYCAQELSGIHKTLAFSLASMARDPTLRSHAKREKWFIDLLLQIRGEGGQVVIGIENKIDAREGEKQVERYQEKLAREYPDAAALLVFLTPDGREPESAAERADVPCVPLAYGELARMLGEGLLLPAAEKSVLEVGSNLVRHMKEEIVGMSEIQAVVRDLWRRHPRAMRLAMRYRPRLDDVKDRCVEELQERLETLNVRYHPKRGKAREIKITPESWWNGGLPVTIMLSDDADGRPSVRILVKKDILPRYRDRLGAWVREVNEANGGMELDETFPEAGWWHVLADRELGSREPDVAEVWDEDTAREAIEVVASWVTTLGPIAEQHLVPGTGPAVR